MFSKMVNAIFSGVAAGLITGTILALFLGSWRWWSRWYTSEEFKVELKSLPKEIVTHEFKFGILYVQNEDGTIKNTTHWFKKRCTGKWYATIRHPRNLGFQYKCFVDNHSKCNFSQISTYLTNAKYRHVSKGGGRPDRIWFILPDKPTTKDARGNLNNYYYPE